MASKAIGFLNFKFGADLGGFDRAMKKAQKNLKRFGKDLQKTGKTLTTNLTLPILGFAAASLKAFDEQQKAIAQVEAGIKSTGMAAGLTSKELQTMAADLQKISLFGDEQILSDVTAQLLTFTGIAGEEFERAQLAALNLSTRLKTDLKSSSIMLGKALNDPVGQLNALSRNGVRFTDVQKDMIKTMVEAGDVAGAQNLILDELSVQFGGAAENARKAGLGGVEGLKNKFMDLTEQIGARLLPVVTKFAEFLVGLLEKFDKLDEGTKDNIVTFGLIVAAIGPILILIGKLSVGLAAASKAFAALNLIMKANPIGVVITVIAALIGYLVYLYNTNQNVRASIKGLFAAAKVYFKGIADLAKNYFVGLGKLIIGVFTFDIDKIMEGFNQSKDAIIDYGKDMGKAFSDAYNEEMSKNVGEDMPEKLTTDFSNIKINDFDEDVQEQITTDFSNISTNNPYKEITEDTNKATEATKQYSEELKVIETDFLFQQSAVEDRFKNIIEWTKKLTQEQKLAQSGFQMFGDILTSSLDDALSSQEKFFPIFIANIKKAIQSLLVQLAVMTLISAIMPASLGGVGKAAFSSKNIIGNIGSIMGFADGGLVTGPTTALIGEGIGTTASNPEVVAPLDKLKQFMGGGSQNVVVEGVIKGNDIFLSNRNTGYNRQRSV
tara:strand:- start:476 stop:2467 length:1992 start_codon:yes stop_codon:yes gene_type:complete